MILLVLLIDIIVANNLSFKVFPRIGTTSARDKIVHASYRGVYSHVYTRTQFGSKDNTFSRTGNVFYQFFLIYSAIFLNKACIAAFLQFRGCSINLQERHDFFCENIVRKLQLKIPRRENFLPRREIFLLRREFFLPRRENNLLRRENNLPRRENFRH